MKYWQFLTIMSAAYITPHLSQTVGILFGCLLAALAIISAWRGE